MNVADAPVKTESVKAESSTTLALPNIGALDLNERSDEQYYEEQYENEQEYYDDFDPYSYAQGYHADDDYEGEGGGYYDDDDEYDGYYASARNRMVRAHEPEPPELLSEDDDEGPSLGELSSMLDGRLAVTSADIPVLVAYMAASKCRQMGRRLHVEDPMLMVQLDHGITAAALLDTGAQTSMASQGFVNKLLRAGNNVPLRKATASARGFNGVRTHSKGQAQIEFKVPAANEVGMLHDCVFRVWFDIYDHLEDTDMLVGYFDLVHTGLFSVLEHHMSGQAERVRLAQREDTEQDYMRVIDLSDSFVQAEIPESESEGSDTDGDMPPLGDGEEAMPPLLPADDDTDSEGEPESEMESARKPRFEETPDLRIGVVRAEAGSAGKPETVAAVNAPRKPVTARADENSDDDDMLNRKSRRESFSGLNQGEASQLKAVLKRYEHVFGPVPREGANVEPLKLKMRLNEHGQEMRPHGRPFGRQSEAARLECKKQVAEYREEGWVVDSQSPIRPAVPVLAIKPDGTWRFTLDYRMLNLCIEDYNYPIPHTKACLERTAGHKYMSAMDLRKGFHQCPLDRDSAHYTVFTTDCELVEWRRVPMGIKVASAYFQFTMYQILGDLVGNGVEVYIDDVIIAHNDFKRFLWLHDQVFKRLSEARLRLKFEKCDFGVDELKYLGHVITKDGMRLDEDRKQALVEMPFPRDVSAMRSFLGMANYFKPFVPSYSILAKPLTALTSIKVQYSATPEALAAFDKIKAACKDSGLLHNPDYTKRLVLRTDASNAGVGGILLNLVDDGSKTPQELTVAVVSQAFNDTQAKWNTTEQEAYAIFYSVTELRHFLLGHRFTLETDHRNLTFLERSDIGKVTRWRLRLQEYTYDVLHRAGVDNTVADALSRVHMSRCMVTRMAIGDGEQDAERPDDDDEEMTEEPSPSALVAAAQALVDDADDDDEFVSASEDSPPPVRISTQQDMNTVEYYDTETGEAPTEAYVPLPHTLKSQGGRRSDHTPKVRMVRKDVTDATKANNSPSKFALVASKPDDSPGAGGASAEKPSAGKRAAADRPKSAFHPVSAPGDDDEATSPTARTRLRVDQAAGGGGGAGGAGAIGLSTLRPLPALLGNGRYRVLTREDIVQLKAGLLGPEVLPDKIASEVVDWFFQCHNGVVGHHGVNATLALMTRTLISPVDGATAEPPCEVTELAKSDPKRLREIVRQLRMACPICQKLEGKIVDYDLARSVLRGQRVFGHVQLDWLGPFPADGDGHTYVLNASCVFCGGIEPAAFRAATADNVVKHLLAIVGRYGVPSVISTDQGSHFTDTTVEKLVKALNIPHRFSVPYHPQSQGQVERLNHELQRHLKAIVADKGCGGIWSHYMPIAAAVVNDTPNARTGFPPSVVINGEHARRPRATTLLFEVPPAAMSVPSFIDKMVQAQRVVADNVRRNNERYHKELMAKQPDADHGFEFEPGMFVLLRNDHKGEITKLSLKWSGPYIIKEKLKTANAYRISNLVPGAEPDYDAHIERLRPYFFAPVVEKAYPLEEVGDTDVIEHPVDKVLDWVIRPTANVTAFYAPGSIAHSYRVFEHMSFLVKWEGHDESQNTWEPFRNLRKCEPFVKFLDDQPVLKEYLNGMTAAQCSLSDAWKDTKHHTQKVMDKVSVQPLWNVPLKQCGPAVFSPDGRHTLPCTHSTAPGRVVFQRLIEPSKKIDFCRDG